MRSPSSNISSSLWPAGPHLHLSPAFLSPAPNLPHTLCLVYQLSPMHLMALTDSPTTYDDDTSIQNQTNCVASFYIPNLIVDCLRSLKVWPRSLLTGSPRRCVYWTSSNYGILRSRHLRVGRMAGNQTGNPLWLKLFRKTSSAPHSAALVVESGVRSEAICSTQVLNFNFSFMSEGGAATVISFPFGISSGRLR